MKYSFLTPTENEFVKEASDKVKAIEWNFEVEIKTIEIYNWDFVRINISREFLEAILEVSKEKEQQFKNRLSNVLGIEYFTHLDYLLLILNRIFDKNRLTQIVAKILSKKYCKTCGIMEEPVKKSATTKLYNFLSEEENARQFESILTKTHYKFAICASEVTDIDLNSSAEAQPIYILS